MKRIWILVMLVILFLASMGVGYFYLNTRDDQKKESKVDENLVENKTITNEYIQAENREQKVSPNASIKTTIKYNQCGHTKTQEEKATKEIVNLNEDELKSHFEDWKVEYFSDKEISLSKQVDETCDEHYIVGESEGIINIYKLNKNGEEELYETTSIYLEYLPEKDQEQIKNKIEVIGMRNLNELLENYD